MPEYIRKYEQTTGKLYAVAKKLSVRIVAVQHIRSSQSKSISKVTVKVYVVNKQKATDYSTSESMNQIFSKTYGQLRL